MYQSTMASSCAKVPWPSYVPKYHGQLMFQSTMAISCAKLPSLANVSKYHGHHMCQSTMAISRTKVSWPSHVLKHHCHLMYQSTKAILCTSHLTYPSRLLQSTMTTSCSRACLKYHSKVPTQRWTVKDTP